LLKKLRTPAPAARAKPAIAAQIASTQAFTRTIRANRHQIRAG
jgi:hypothetical protein